LVDDNIGKSLVRNYSRPVRLFIAISPGEGVLLDLARSVGPMKVEPWAKQVRWIKPESIHLTLRFLGNSDVHIVSDLNAALKSSLLCKAFNYTINEIAVFPSARKPSVIAALVSESPELTRLAESVEEIVREFGYQSVGKRFRGHITLGRCRRGFPRGTVIQCPIKPITATAEELILYESDTKPAGAVYVALARIALVDFIN
jgi:2'-5' RNA ligase